jgi:hypothetical protein
VQVSASADPGGLAVGLDAAGGHGLTRTLIEGSTAVISAASPQWMGGQEFRFLGWDDGDTASLRTVRVTSDRAFVGRFLRPPAVVAAPEVAGGAQVGSTLTLRSGAWSGDQLSVASAWERCDAAGEGCVAVPGATGAGYSITEADLGHRLRVRSEATNGVGSASTSSAPTTPVEPAAAAPPQPPAAADRTAPKLRLRAPRRQRLRRLRLRATCATEPCALTVRARLVPSGGRGPAVRRALAAGRARVISARLTRVQRAAAGRALRRRGFVRVRLLTTATDPAGNRATRRLTLTLRR